MAPVWDKIGSWFAPFIHPSSSPEPNEIPAAKAAVVGKLYSRSPQIRVFVQQNGFIRRVCLVFANQITKRPDRQSHKWRDGVGTRPSRSQGDDMMIINFLSKTASKKLITYQTIFFAFTVCGNNYTKYLDVINKFNSGVDVCELPQTTAISRTVACIPTAN